MSDEWAVPQDKENRRHFSASAMAVALILFPLPWIELSCGAAHPPGKEKEIYFTITQSGLQSIYGGTTYYGRRP